MSTGDRWGSGVLGRPLVQDVLLAAVIGVLGVVSLWNPPPVDLEFRDPDVGGVLLVLVAAWSVPVRRARPVLALVVSLVALVAVILLGYSQTAAGLPALLNLYAVASRRPFRPALGWGLATVAAIVTVLLAGPIEPSTNDWIANALILVTGWSLGRTARSRRAQLASLVQRDDALATAADAELTARLVRDRAEMAREVQDLVAHKLTEITVQVAAARRTVPIAPDVAIQMLAEIEASGRNATQEMRRLLQLMADGDRAVQLEPVPGLAALQELVRAEEARGARVTIEEEGTPAPIAHGAALTAYRLIEETLAHAREGRWATAVVVRLGWAPGALEITVKGDEPAPLGWDDQLDQPSGALAKLTRRVGVYGGQLRWGRGPGGAFRVTASLPIDDGSPA